MTDINKFDDEELLEVSGGGKNDINFKYKAGDRKNGPCKYCGAMHSLVYDRRETGWEKRRPFECNVFICERCGQESYFAMKDDHLLM